MSLSHSGQSCLEELQEAGWIRLHMRCNTPSEVILLPHFGNR
jgi:hypothetical protein